jgi:hypothetical protein
MGIMTLVLCTPAMCIWFMSLYYTSHRIRMNLIAILTPKERLSSTTALCVALWHMTYVPSPRPAVEPILITVPPFPPVDLSMYFKAVKVPCTTPFWKSILNYWSTVHISTVTVARNMKLEQSTKIKHLVWIIKYFTACSDMWNHKFLQFGIAGYLKM